MADSTLVLPPRYLGSVDYYASIATTDNAVVNAGARFNKRDKATHRTTIADANGIINLTIPIEKPKSLSATLCNDIVISAHDSWWNIHFTALRSAYGRTPFFEFYADDFETFYNAEWAGRRLIDYTSSLDALICRLLGIKAPRVSESHIKPSDGVSFYDGSGTHPVEYYQVRSLKYGFTPNLSIVDLLFNMGPEAPLVLESMKNAD